MFSKFCTCFSCAGLTPVKYTLSLLFSLFFPPFFWDRIKTGTARQLPEMPPKGFTKKKVLQSPSSLKEVHAALKRPRSPPRASDVPPQQPPPPPPPSLPLEAEASPRKKRGRPRRPHRELQGTRESTPLASAPATDATATAVTAVTATAVTATAVTATARTPAGPPPLLGCLAACFGWRLVSYAASEDGTARFGLRHVADASVAVSVVVPPQAFEVSPETPAPAVLINGIAVPLAECPAHLQQLREDGGQRRLSSLPQASAAALPATPPAVQPTPEEGGAKAVPVGLRPPSKRQRSPSLSPPPLLTAAEEPQPPPSPPPSRPLNLVSTSGDTTREDRATEGAAQEEQLDASPDEQPSVEEPPPLVISREEEDVEEDTVSVLVLKAEERSTPSPSSSSVESPSADGGAPVKEEFFFALIAEGAAGPPPPPDALPLDVQPRNSASEATITATVIADTTAAAASKQMSAETVMVAVAAAATADDKSASPPARLPSSVASLVRRALLGSRSPHPRRTDSGGVLSESAIKKEQQLVGTASTAPAFDATVASVGAPPVTHSPSSPVLPLLPPQGAVRRSFVMPYMTLSSSASCGTTNASPKGAGAASNDGSGGFAMNAFIGADGCTATSSRSWLAHTHAVSRTFGLARAVPEEKEAKAEANTTAAAVASVRVTLRQRWLQRSSLWSHMEESLRLSVGSGRLRGDALEAGVLALQAGEKELLLYDGVRESGADSPPLRPFPTPVPRPLLPVSGTMVVEAQHRIAAAEEAEASAHYHHNTQSSSRKRSTLAPRYTVYPDGIPAADRLVIDRTYTTRGSYVVATAAAAPFSFGGKGVKAESTSKAKGNSGMASLPVLCENPESDLYSYVFKRYPAPNASEPPLAVAVLDGADALSSAVAPAAKEENSEEDGHLEDKREETRADSGPHLVGLTSPSPTATTTATHLTADVAEAVSAMDLDYVLRYRPNIRRIPMPDVESRYGL